MRSPLQKSIEICKTLLLSKTNNVRLQFLRFFITGGIAGFLHLGTLILLTELFGVYYLLSTFFGYILSVIFIYVVSVRFIFHNKKHAKKTTEFSMFFIIRTIGLGLNQFLMWLFPQVFGLNYVVSQVIVALLLVFVNFLGQKLFVFN